MVQLARDAKTNGAVGGAVWVSAMRQAGLSEQEIERVVTATATISRLENGQGEIADENGRGELVPVKEAARRIGRSENTVRSWIRLGHLRTADITPPRDHANGPWVHVYMAEVEELEDRTSHPDADEGELLTLKEAAERFGIPVGRLQNWYARGHLTVHGRRKGPAPGGGLILVSTEEVAALIANPPRRGRQPNLTDDT